MYVWCLSLLVCMSCSKDELIQEQQTIDLTKDLSAKSGPAPKIMICHYAEDENIWVALEVNSNSLKAHVKHGDAVDMDGDGYYNKKNGCSETDCDDTTYSEDNSCGQVCVVISPLTDANFLGAVILWSNNQAEAISTYGHISTWCTSNITKMNRLFRFNTSFNEDISSWDVSNVTEMAEMFYGATSFNQDISRWDVSKVTNMVGLFESADSFNQDISKWDVSRVLLMTRMFSNADSFNQDIGNWDVSSVISMQVMFAFTESFNQDIGRWDVSSVISVFAMFRQAVSFNQDLSGWCVSNFPVEPSSFDENATAWTKARPVWGTCPI